MCPFVRAAPERINPAAAPVLAPRPAPELADQRAAGADAEQISLQIWCLAIPYRRQDLFPIAREFPAASRSWRLQAVAAVRRQAELALPQPSAGAEWNPALYSDRRSCSQQASARHSLCCAAWRQL